MIRPTLLALLALGCNKDPSTGTDTENPGETDAPVATGHLEASGPIDCAEPALRAASPLTRITLGEGWEFAPDYGTASWDLRWGGRGIVVGDFDADGHLDILAPQYTEASRLLMGIGDGTFAEAPLPDVEGVEGAIGGATADIDGDADLDVFLYGQLSPPVLLVNDGAGGFTGTAHPEWDDESFIGCGGSASFADYDLDGDVDLFYGRLGALRNDGTGGQYYFSCPSRLLENQGDGSFLDVSDVWLGPDLQELRVMASGWHPFDDDPYPELYVVTDALLEGVVDTDVPDAVGSNILYDNGPEGLFRKVDDSLDWVAAGMGLGAADLNGDGLVDPLTPDVNRLIALESVGTTWANQAANWGLQPAIGEGQSVAWGGDYADLDNDGDYDLLITYGAIPDGTKHQPDEVYVWCHDCVDEDGDPAPHFERAAAAWAWDDPEPTRGVLAVDLNDDGWLDIVKRVLGGVVMVDMAACGSETWLTMRLEGPAPNVHAIGATVHVFAGDQTFSRMVTSGSTSFASGGPPEVHFGLGELAAIDRIEVTWPDGEVTAYPGLETRQHLLVKHPSR